MNSKYFSQHLVYLHCLLYKCIHFWIKFIWPLVKFLVYWILKTFLTHNPCSNTKSFRIVFFYDIKTWCIFVHGVSLRHVGGWAVAKKWFCKKEYEIKFKTLLAEFLHRFIYNNVNKATHYTAPCGLDNCFKVEYMRACMEEVLHFSILYVLCPLFCTICPLFSIL